MNKPVKITLTDKFALFDDYWSPKIIADLNESYVKVAKFKNEFNWHHHENEDELFIVVKGNLTIKFEDEDRQAGPGEMILIPRMVEHCPVADEEVWVVLIEPKATLNTGNIRTENTVENLERI